MTRGRNFLVNRWESKSIIVINSLILPRVCDCILHSGLTDFLFHAYSWYVLLYSSIFVLYAALGIFVLYVTVFMAILHTYNEQ